jgi:putative restriction endonuclease
MPAVIVENDESAWDDQTGALYHFPERYLSILQPGERVIYYKGRMRNKRFAPQRLSPDAHYRVCPVPRILNVELLDNARTRLLPTQPPEGIIAYCYDSQSIVVRISSSN